MMLEAGTYLLPTLTVAHAKVARGEEANLSAESLDKARRVCPIRMENAARAYKAGVKIACGSDTASVAIHGRNAKELGLLVQVGLSPMEAIQSATSVAAEAIGISELVGTLKDGKEADLLVIDGDPTQDIKIFQDPEKIRAIYKAGKLINNRLRSI
jgi:imidazolonepropionase-like amidohydrolase